VSAPGSLVFLFMKGDSLPSFCLSIILTFYPSLSCEELSTFAYTPLLCQGLYQGEAKAKPIGPRLPFLHSVTKEESDCTFLSQLPYPCVFSIPGLSFLIYYWLLTR
jgi:hypothetical protein